VDVLSAPADGMNVVDGTLDFSPAKEAVGGFVAESGECFWRAEEACAQREGGRRTEGREFLGNAGWVAGVCGWTGEDDDGDLRS
jgi:hypothetical protein